MDIESTFKFNPIGIGKIDDSMRVALINTADALMGNIKNAQVIPVATSALKDSLDIVETYASEGRVYLTQTTPYARRLYFHPEYQFNQAYAANAKGKWFEDWLPGGDRDTYAQLRFNAFMRKELNDA